METAVTTLLMIGLVNFFFGLMLWWKGKAKRSSMLHVVVGLFGFMAAIVLCHGDVSAAFMARNQPTMNPWICGIVFYVSFIGLLFCGHRNKESKKTVH